MRADGGPSQVHSGSTVSGIEMTIKNFAPIIYYGGTFIGRDIAPDANGKRLIGYSYTGSANIQNGAVQEIMGDWPRTIWRDPEYGALQESVQHAYFFFNLWYVAPGSPKTRMQCGDDSTFGMRCPAWLRPVEYWIYRRRL